MIFCIDFYNKIFVKNRKIQYVFIIICRSVNPDFDVLINNNGFEMANKANTIYL